MSTALRETVYKLISDAFYEARNASRTMTDATNAATDAVLAALAPPTVEQIAEVARAHVNLLSSTAVNGRHAEWAECMGCDWEGPERYDLGDSLADHEQHVAQWIAALYPGVLR